jgi:drug/metabolite transporter (DMT)-like permease
MILAPCMSCVCDGLLPAIAFPAGLDFLQNGVFIAIIANGLIGASLVWDKVLLKQPETRNLVSYVFWLGAISIFGLLLTPFGFHWPGLSIALLALVTGMLHLAAIWFYYAALKRGEASQTLAVMGGFSPIATALIAIPLLRHPYLARGNLPAFALLVIGGFVMFLSEKLNLRRTLPHILLASGLFGLVNVLQKAVFDNTNFVSGYVMFTLGTFVGALFLLVPPRWRRQVFVSSGRAEPHRRFWYFVNRFVSGVGSFLIFYAIDLTHPAVVDAISGVRYAVIFVTAYGVTQWRPRWLKENFRGWTLAGKSLATLLIVAGLVLLGLSGLDQNSGPSTRLVAPASLGCPEGHFRVLSVLQL